MTQPSAESTSRADRVAVIVATRNSAATLDDCLSSIRGQTHRAVDLVVVDNGSTDGTRVIAERHADQVLEGGPERSAQRNLGVAATAAPWVLIVDSDMVLGETVVERCLEAASKSGAVCVVVPELSVGRGFWARCRALERSCYVGDASIEAARFFAREAFDAVGGYDEALTGPEDWDLPARLRAHGPAARCDAWITHLEGSPTLGGLMRKKYYYGRSFGAYVRRHPGLAARQLQVVRPAFLRHWRKLASEPVVGAGVVVLKLAEFAAGGAGVAAEQITGGRRTEAPR